MHKGKLGEASSNKENESTCKTIRKQGQPNKLVDAEAQHGFEIQM